MDDTRTVVLSLRASGGQSTRGEPILLVLRCRSGETEAFIRWNDYLGLDEARVTTRIGNAKAETRSWNISTDNLATFYRRNDVEFIKALLNTDRFLAQVTPYGENPVTATFDITGLSIAVVPLRETCGW